MAILLQAFPGIRLYVYRRQKSPEYFPMDASLVAFVCTSPLSHSAVISECIKKGLHIFTELNLVADGYLENIKSPEYFPMDASLVDIGRHDTYSLLDLLLLKLFCQYTSLHPYTKT